jgi:hypothetical protein
MRTLLAIVIFAGGLSALSPAADAGRKSIRSAKAPYSAARLRNYRRGNAVCERRARADDPNGSLPAFRAGPAAPSVRDGGKCGRRGRGIYAKRRGSSAEAAAR